MHTSKSSDQLSHVLTDNHDPCVPVSHVLRQDNRADGLPNCKFGFCYRYHHRTFLLHVFPLDLAGSNLAGFVLCAMWCVERLASLNKLTSEQASKQVSTHSHPGARPIENYNVCAFIDARSTLILCVMRRGEGS